MIVGITGTLGSGKGTVAQYLVGRGYLHFSARDFITDEISRQGLTVDRDTMVEVGNDLRRQNGSSYIIKQLYARASQETADCVIESIRTMGEVEYLRQQTDFILLAIDAEPRVRYDRIRERKQETDNVSFEVFMENEAREMGNTDPAKQNLRACIESADITIVNNGSLGELHAEIERQLINPVK